MEKSQRHSKGVIVLSLVLVLVFGIVCPACASSGATTLAVSNSAGSTTTIIASTTISFADGSAALAVSSSPDPTTTYGQVTATAAEGIIPLIRLNVLEDVSDTHSIDTSSTVPGDMNDMQMSELGSVPVADAGGPYTAAAGASIVFDGSKTSASAGISKAVWNYGDGAFGAGLRTNHSYASAGFYRAILSVTDEAGKKGEDSRMVHVYPELMNVKISVLPKNDDGIYNPGEYFSIVEVNVTRPDGSPVEKAYLTGIIAGRSVQYMAFTELGNGLYRYSKEYDILLTESPFIDIYVNVTDPNGTTLNAFKKLRTVYDNSESRIILSYPSYNKFVVAYGEPLSFRVKLFSSAGTVHAGDVYLFEADTNQRYQLRQVGDEYLLEYTVPRDIGKYLNLIFYASFSVNNANYHAVLERNFDVSPDLSLEDVSLDAVESPGVQGLKLAVMYPGGEPVTEDYLNATIGNVPVILGRVKENGVIFYGANYSLSEAGERPYLWVIDSSGNGAGIYLQTESGDGPEISGNDSRFIPAAAALIALFTLSALLLRTQYKKRHKRMLLVKEYEDLHQKIESLKKIRKNIMHEYYTRKITEQDARKRILEAEKELVMERGNMKAAMQKLGMAPGETEGKEEIIEWVTEKLKAGENMELIKKGLKDLNMDPLLAEKVRKILT
ncbi:MAG: PKD domain-containing protein [Candidatus Altiarchaeia archaeon]